MARWLIPAALALTAMMLFGAHTARHASGGTLQVASRALIAGNWHDRGGRLLPVFVQTPDESWVPPLPVYVGGLVSSLLPAVDGIAVTAALMGALDVALLYVLALRLFRSVGFALLASVLLLTSAVHIWNDTLASPDGVWDVPFLLVWLIALTSYMRDPADRRHRLLACAAAALGMALYTQPSAWVVVCGCAALSVAVVARTTSLKWAHVWPACAAFAAAVCPVIAWLAAHPAVYVDTVGRWLLHPAHLRDPVGWMQAVLTPLTLGVWAHVFWGLLSPVYLFIDETSPAMLGAFAAPLAPLVVAGLAAAFDRNSDQWARLSAFRLVAITFVVVLMSVATFKESLAIQRAVVVAPLGILLASLGARSFWQRASAPWRAVPVVLVLMATMQFAAYWLARRV